MSTLRAVKKSMNPFAGPTATPIYSNSYRGGKDFWFFNADGHDYRISFNGHNSALKAYLQCPPLAAIINKKAQAFTNGKTFIINKKGKARDKEATSEVANKVRSLMANPNPFQSQKEFEAQQYTYLQIWGWCIVLSIKPVGFDNTDAKKLWNIPPAMIDVEETKNNWLLADKSTDVIKSIIINFENEKVPLPVSDCYIIKDITVSFTSPAFPESRTCSLRANINNTIGAYESRGKLIEYRGALGIISPDFKDAGGPIPLKDDDKEALQEEFKQYGLKRNQYSFIISNAAVKWSQMGIPTSELMLFEEIEDNIMRICDGYNFPYPLMSSNRTNSLGGNNIYEAKKLLYQDATIPEAENISEQWTTFFSLDKYELKIVKDFSHVEALQDDKLQYARWRNTLNDAKKKEYDAGLITLNDWLIALGEDPLPDELGNVRASDVKNSNIPLAVTIGVGGVQGLISVITAQGMSVEARQATLEIVFGLAAADAMRMAQETEPTETQQQPQTTEQQ